MSRQTKLELSQVNTRIAAENEALRKQVADLQLNVELLTAKVASCEAPAHRIARHTTPQWQIDRMAAMTAARELAMRTRMSIKV